MFYRHKKTGIIYNRPSYSHIRGVITHTFTPLKNKGYDTKDKIEVSTNDEAIKRLQTDKKLVKSVIDGDYSSLHNNVPTDFVVKTYSYEEDCDLEIEVYDYYRE